RHPSRRSPMCCARSRREGRRSFSGIEMPILSRLGPRRQLRRGSGQVHHRREGEMGFLTPAPRRARKRGGVRRGGFVLALAFGAAACGPAAESRKPVAPGEWLEFEGTWSAAGSRHTISLGEDRIGAIIDLKGSLLLTG